MDTIARQLPTRHGFALWDYFAVLTTEHETTVTVGTVEATHLITARLFIADALPGAPRPIPGQPAWWWSQPTGCELLHARPSGSSFRAYRCEAYARRENTGVTVILAPRWPLRFSIANEH
ncbi:hypothetical protein [Tsukamurella ocularis]|uniref:hypothetical protein n=1 Tax=Tsukamurella ocularis TaxID=1970234 RepID=UPI0021692BEA|nr:hypothetical protein [Tsukamurella ocularis]MCS3779357.1 hypothetical protein [Tsukamurella ocularis]MCS3789913.1 hypothetical protein [Tsukamurella ocularis]